MFFKFVDCFQDQTFSQDIKAMILQHIIIPMFEESFKKGMSFVSECLPRTVFHVLLLQSCVKNFKKVTF